MPDLSSARRSLARPRTPSDTIPADSADRRAEPTRLMESLENRRLLAAIWQEYGTVNIVGDSWQANVADVHDEGGWIRVGLNGQEQWFEAWKVTRFEFQGGQHNDEITVANSLTQPLTAYGRQGNDTLDGGGGPDRLFGHEGNDDLDGDGGADYLSGKSGDDRLDGDGGWDSLRGGDGWDRGYDGEDVTDVEAGDNGNGGNNGGNNGGGNGGGNSGGNGGGGSSGGGSGGGSSGQQPYNHTPRPVPGKIEAEHFDYGGEGTAYHDTTDVDLGNQGVRGKSKVDLQSGNGVTNVGWAANGEWLEYTVDVAQAGNYDVRFRGSTNNSGGAVRVSVDGQQVESAVWSNGWSNYATQTAGTVWLGQGQRVVRVSFHHPQGWEAANLDWIEFKPAGNSGGGDTGGGDTGGGGTSSPDTGNGGGNGGGGNDTGGNTGGGTANPNAAHPDANISVVNSLNIMAGSSVHLNAKDSSAGAGSLDTARIEWDFGDPSGRYNTIRGYNAGHLYDSPGTYTAKLKIWNQDLGYDEASVTVHVAPDTRQKIYVAPWGSDSNSGLNQNSPLRTLKRASQRLWDVGDNTKILLARGQVHEVNELVYLDRNNVVLGAYGNGGKPVIRWTRDRYAGNNKTVVWFDTDRSQLTVRDVEFDQAYNDTSSYGLPSSLQPSGKGIAVVDTVFRDVGDAITGSGKPHGVLVMDNSVPSDTDLRRYFTWIEGSDWTILGNDVPNSTREHIVRVGNGARINVGDNRFSNLDRRGNGDPHDYAKGVLNIQRGSYAYLWNNDTKGPSGVGPLGEADGLDTPHARFRHAVFEGNNLENGPFIVEHGAEDVQFRSNVIEANGVTAILVDGWEPAYNRTVRNLNIVNNTILNNQSVGKAARLFAGSENVNVSNNLYVAPSLYAGPYGTSVIRVDAPNLNGFSKIENNVWADAAIDPWAGGLMWVGTGDDNSGYLSASQWNNQWQVDHDTFSDVWVDSSYRPGNNSAADDGGTEFDGVLVDYHGAWRKTGSGRSIGAVER